MSAGDFIKTDVEGIVRAARGGARAIRRCSGSCRSRPTRSTAACPRDRAPRPTNCEPRNPYAASKAGADRLAYSYWATYDVPVIITRASNNYGPYQFPEKILPLFVTNLIDNIPVPLYGDGGNVRDWLHVLDHCRAVDMLMQTGAQRRGLQHRRRQRGEEHRPHAPVLKLAGKGPELIKPVAGSPGSRSPLQPRHREAARDGLGAAGRLRAGARARPSPGTRRTSGGGVRSRNATRATRPTSKRNTASALIGHGSGDRRRRLRRQPSARAPRTRLRQIIVAWLRPGTQPLVRGSRVKWIDIEMHDRDAVNRAIAEARPAARSTTWPACRTSANRGAHARNLRR